MKVRRRYKFVIEDWDRHGNVRVYLRRPGKSKLRLHEEPGTLEFDAEYRRAMEGRIKPAPARQRTPDAGSLRSLCMAYFGSAEHKQMEPRSRHVRRMILDKLCDQHGDKPAGLMEARHVRQIRDARADAPEAANGMVKALRAVFRHAMQVDLVRHNPARDVEYLRSGSEGFHTWTADEVSQFEARHPIGSKARLALALLLLTGAAQIRRDPTGSPAPQGRMAQLRAGEEPQPQAGAAVHPHAARARSRDRCDQRHGDNHDLSVNREWEALQPGRVRQSVPWLVPSSRPAALLRTWPAEGRCKPPR